VGVNLPVVIVNYPLVVAVNAIDFALEFLLDLSFSAFQITFQLPLRLSHFTVELV
jgi:hypothetical protein